jgi:hypothetical protein
MNSMQQRLMNSLYSLAGNEDIARVLGIQDISSQSEEFWKGQRMAVKNRFYWYCLDDLKMPMVQEIEELDINDLLKVISHAEELLNDGNFDYSTVRDWFKSFGQFEADRMFKHRREVRDLETQVLRVLFIFDRGAKYLKYESKKPVLCDLPADAHAFKVNSLIETTKEYLTEMAVHFSALKEEFGAKQVKVLLGRTN